MRTSNMHFFTLKKKQQKGGLDAANDLVVSLLLTLNMYLVTRLASHLHTFTCSNLRTETTENCAKYLRIKKPDRRR